MEPSQSQGAISVRQAEPRDVAAILALIRELASYERLPISEELNEHALSHALFGPRPAAEAALAELDGRYVGYALYFSTFSTFAGRPGIYLEDVYVQPHARGRGVGKLLLRYVARVAVERNCGRMEWTVLNWNQSSLEFYEALGAKPLNDWMLYRLSGADLLRAANGGEPPSEP